MPHETAVKDVMVPITELPHMPYWFSLRQAITMMRLAKLEEEKELVRIILVFDEKSQLLGYLRQEDVLRGLEPRFLSAGAKGFDGAQAPAPELAALWSDPKASREASNAAVKDFMVPVRSTVRLDDSVTRAACLMIDAGAPLLAVTDGHRVAGIVRIEDVFEVITRAVIDG
jgi:Mg/Co/Ni transporter MgtE